MHFDVNVHIRAIAHLAEHEQFDISTAGGPLRVHTIERLGNHRVALTGVPHLKTGGLGKRARTEVRDVSAVDLGLLDRMDQAVYAEVLRRTISKINLTAPMGA